MPMEKIQSNGAKFNNPKKLSLEIPLDLFKKSTN